MIFVCPKWAKCNNYHHDLPCWKREKEQITEIQICLKFEAIK